MLDSGKHVRPDLCCLGMMYSCGHTATCMYDMEWKLAHDKAHKWDWVPETLFWGSVFIAFVVWLVTR